MSSSNSYDYQTRKKIADSIQNSWLKAKRIHDELIELEKQSDSILVIKLSIFLTRSQWLEYCIDSLIYFLNLKLSTSNEEIVISRKDIDKSTLGLKTKMLKDYTLKDKSDQELLEKIIKGLEQFVVSRNTYTHHLFKNSKSAKLVMQELDSGTKTCETLTKLVADLYRRILPDLHESMDDAFGSSKSV